MLKTNATVSKATKIAISKLNGFIRTNNTEEALKLIATLQDEEVNCREDNTDCYSPLERACLAHNVAVVEKLVERNVNVSELNPYYKQNSLHFLADKQNGQKDTVQSILTLLVTIKGLDVNTIDNRPGIGQTPLMTALTKNNRTLIEALLEYKTIDINIKDKHNKTFLDYLIAKHGASSDWVQALRYTHHAKTGDEMITANFEERIPSAAQSISVIMAKLRGTNDSSTTVDFNQPINIVTSVSPSDLASGNEQDRIYFDSTPQRAETKPVFSSQAYLPASSKSITSLTSGSSFHRPSGERSLSEEEIKKLPKYTSLMKAAAKPGNSMFNTMLKHVNDPCILQVAKLELERRGVAFHSYVTMIETKIKNLAPEVAVTNLSNPAL